MGAASNITQRVIKGGVTLGASEMPGFVGDAGNFVGEAVTHIPQAALRTAAGVNTMLNAGADAARNQSLFMDALLRDQQSAEAKQLEALNRKPDPKAAIVEPINDRNKRLQALRAGMMATLKTSTGAAASKPSLVSPALTGLALKQKLGA